MFSVHATGVANSSYFLRDTIGPNTETIYLLLLGLGPFKKNLFLLGSTA